MDYQTHRDELLDEALVRNELRTASELLQSMSAHEVVQIIERSSPKRGAIIFRLLSKMRALQVFEELAPAMQGELLHGLRDDEVASFFGELQPDDRAGLIDELPAIVAQRALRGLSEHQRAMTTMVLGYPAKSVGRRMSPEYVRTHPEFTVDETLAIVRGQAADAETIYTIPVTDHAKVLVGVVSLRDLLKSDPGTVVADIMQPPVSVQADSSVEAAARLCTDLDLIALLIVDSEDRLLGILTFDDANQVLRDAEAEDTARAGASEPLGRPYLTTSVFLIARSRVVWLLVLAVSALLTVQVLEIFEATLEQMVVLALFIPLLTGTGGNTGTQAATTITRALAVGEVRASDVGKVLFREVRVGAMLGLLLGSLGFVLASLFYDMPTGIVIGTTLFCVCAMAATVGGAMPLLAKAMRVDPAVFSTPFITTFCDATGLLIYFTIARAVLGL